MIVETRTRTLDSGPTVLSISGRLTLGNTLMGIERAIDKLIADGVRQLIVDVAGMNSLDSAGIGIKRIISLYPDVDAAADALKSGTAAHGKGSAA